MNCYYHIHVYVTVADGYQVFTSFDFKMLYTHESHTH